MKPTWRQPSTRTSKLSFASELPLPTFGVPPLALGTALASHFLLNTDLRLSVLVGVAVSVVMLAPQLMISIVFVIIYALINAISVLAGVIYIVGKRQDPAKYFMNLLADSTNLAISFQNRTPTVGPLRADMDSLPVTQGKSETAAPANAAAQAPSPGTGPPLAPLPPAPGKAVKEDTPQYWRTVQALADRPGGRPDVVAQPMTGRHARTGDDAPSQSVTEGQRTIRVS